MGAGVEHHSDWKLGGLEKKVHHGGVGSYQLRGWCPREHRCSSYRDLKCIFYYLKMVFWFMSMEKGLCQLGLGERRGLSKESWLPTETISRHSPE